ncbi:MAG TPA: AAA family ATPase [Terriglobia bacterium]|nr:AAA family ATPase [Terriglobia bacterium]
MSFTIAITGKGGVGKTTLAGLLVTRLVARGCRPILAVDADPNMCLDVLLGVKAEHTVGRLREEAREIAGRGLSVGISKRDLLELKISQSLVEGPEFDLIAMGRPEGPGCYCYANNVLKVTLEEIAASYPFAVIDNEAGLENLSRRIVQKADLLVLVSDPSERGLATVDRLLELAREMKVEYGRLAVVVNRLRTPLFSEAAERLRDSIRPDYFVGLPEDQALAELGEKGGSLWALKEPNEVVARVDNLLSEIGLLTVPMGTASQGVSERNQRELVDCEVPRKG